jgi:hypothetical protein
VGVLYCYSGSSTFNGEDRVFEFYKPDNTGYLTVNLFADTTLDLDVFVLDQCGNVITNCIGASTTQFWYEFIYDLPPTPVPSGTYYVVVDDFNNSNAGPFDISVTCGNLSCSGAEPISCGETKFSENNLSGPNNVSAYQYSNGAYQGGFTGNEKVYSFSLAQTQEVEIDLFGFSGNQDFELFLADNCFQFDIIAESTNTPGSPEEIITTLSPGTYYIIVDGWNGTNGSFNISLDCCQTTINYGCDDILCFPTFPANSYSYQLVNTNSQNYAFNWTVNGIGIGSGNNVNYTFPGGGSYSVCFSYYDSNNCEVICCTTVCIPPINSCNLIDYEYLPSSNTYLLSLNTSSSDVTWVNTATGSELGYGQEVLIPVPGSCQMYSICAYYYDSGSECYSICYLNLWICDPYDCNDIIYSFNGVNGYDLTFTGGGSNLTWYNDDTGQLLGSGSSVYIPIGPTCLQFNASVHYYDEGCGCWVVCCISFWLCDPYDCDDIIYAYNGEDGYDLSLPGSGNSNISWYNDDTGELLGSGSSVFYSS